MIEVEHTPTRSLGDDELHQHPSSVSRGLSSSPVIGRVAGLSLEAAVSPFGSVDCAEMLREQESLTREAVACRREIVDIVESRLTAFDGSRRRFLLSVKRDCFNGRPLRKHVETSDWEIITRLAPVTADRLLSLDDQIDATSRALRASHRQELARERLHVLRLLDDDRFVRGVAIATPGLIQKARKKAPKLASSGCRRSPSKWEESLLRFATRAATKLSPNSTLTAYALGSLREAREGRPALDRLQSRSETSLVRVDRPPIEQFQTLLLQHPAVRRHALVTWNDSAEEIEPGTFRFVRDAHLSFDESTGEFAYNEAAKIKAKLPERFRVPALRAALTTMGPAVAYDDLLDRLQAQVGDDAQEALDQLLSIGFLVLLPPWPDDEPRLEARIREVLEPLAETEPAVRAITEALDKLVGLEEGFAEASCPEQQVVAMRHAFARLMDEASPAEGASIAIGTRTRFYEDDLQHPGDDHAMDRGVFALGSDAAEAMLRIVSLISRFDSLFNFRHDVAHSLAAWWRLQAPNRRDMPFLELAESFAPIWKTFPDFQKASRKDPGAPWDPLCSASLTTLSECREWALARVAELLETSEGHDVLPADALEELVESLPARYRPLVGVSVFFQPLDAEGSAWVLNNITEGTGRYLSRVTPLLRGPHRNRFLDHLAARSTIEVDGETAQLLEVKHPRQHLVRAHPAQAARVLDLRGFHLEVPRERRCRLEDLVVRADLETDTLRLVDRDGRRILPVSLSTLPNAGLSNRLRLLLMFGPHETRGIFPPATSRVENGVAISNRLTCENVVLRRKHWRVPVDALRRSLERLDDCSCYERVDQWRHRYRLPREGYFRELASCGKYKPQFVRFDSPFLCRLFVRSLLQSDNESLSFSEALPAPSDYPIDSDGQHHAFELLLDQLSIRSLEG